MPDPGTEYRELAAATAPRKQLYALVAGVVLLNLILFLRFGLARKPAPDPAATAGNSNGAAGTSATAQ
jgi:hypothetical protein